MTPREVPILSLVPAFRAKGEAMKKTKMQQWEVARNKVVSSATFIKMFERARAKMTKPKRKTCKHGHPICAANAHVGDLKRLGVYACDPCNRIAQVRYMKNAAKGSK
jgi:hypothetical protein